jgi:hypothetical protein
MNMPLPIPGVETGPTYASQISGYNNTSTTSCLQILDGHDHSFGKGVQITPAGLNISSDLSVKGNNLTTARSVRFSAQGSLIPAVSPDIGCVYFSGVDAYINDLSGNQIRLTQSGGVAGSPGAIGGLSSPASVNYSGGTFVFQSAANTSANLDCESVVLRNSTTNSKGLTLNPPSSMSSNYAIQLPAITSSATSFLAMDSSGNITEPYPISNGLTRSTFAAVGQSVSSTSGVFSTNSNSYVTALSCSLTTTGRPVMLVVQSDGNIAHTANIGVSELSGNTASGYFSFFRNGTQISTNILNNTVIGATQVYLDIGPGSLNFLDTPSAGTYNYTLQVFGGNGTNGYAFVTFCQLIAYEL